MDTSRPLVPALVLALGLVLAATIFGLFFYNARSPEHTIQVVGAATRSFETDVAKWRLSLSRSVGLDGLAGGYAALGQSVDGVRAQLGARGVADTSVSVLPATAHPRYSQYGEVTGYEVQQSLTVVSGDVDTIEAFALNPGVLDTGGAVLQGSSIEYYYDDLATLKHELLGLATADARRRAAEIAGSDGLEMTAARAGVFQITEPYSTEVASYGIHATGTRRQEITVTVHATFVAD